MSEQKMMLLLLCGAALVAIYLVIGTALLPDSARLPAILFIAAILAGLGIIRR